MGRLLIALLLLATATVQAQSTTFLRGEIVRVQEMERPTALRIVAIPNDRIRSNDSGIYVNDVAVTGFSSEFLSRAVWRSQVVPEGHYFLMGEERLNQVVSEHIGLHPGTTLERMQ